MASAIRYAYAQAVTTARGKAILGSLQAAVELQFSGVKSITHISSTYLLLLRVLKLYRILGRP